ncbi:MAG: outer membrane lipoprotein-sorting protein [Deltaproteobacteria bacterium]|nr:outer membrane lipoprotein-sorting protein [Deltaproteobacteria bacterium]
MRTCSWILLFCVTLATPAGATPGAPRKSARALMDSIFRRASWRDMRGKIRLVLQNKRGVRKLREIKMWSKKNEKDESRILMRFIKPADVRGTGFLLIEHDDGDDDRRLFLPALRRVQRISTSGSGGNFMSSDFTYYDIGRPKLRHWHYSESGERVVGGVKCRLVTGKAVSKKVREDTGYSQIVWVVDEKRGVVVASDFFNKWDKKFKVLEVKKIEDLSGVPFATQMLMRDLTNGHRSEMSFIGLKTNIGIPDRTFTSRNLLRWTR